MASRYYEYQGSVSAPPAIIISMPAVNNIAFHLTVTCDSAFHLPGFEEADEVRETFVQLADEWHQETEHLSSPVQIAMHPAYQRIIGMGQEAVPFILHDLQTRGGHWYWALRAITAESPAPATAAGNLRAVRDAWLTWGEQRGYLFPSQ